MARPAKLTLEELEYTQKMVDLLKSLKDLGYDMIDAFEIVTKRELIEPYSLETEEDTSRPKNI